MADDASQDWVDRSLAGLTAVVVLSVPLALVATPSSGTVAVLGPPGRDTAALVARAGGSILRMGGWSNVLVVRAGSPDLVARLYAAGAWLVVDARFASGCDPVPLPQSQRI